MPAGTVLGTMGDPGESKIVHVPPEACDPERTTYDKPWEVGEVHLPPLTLPFLLLAFPLAPLQSPSGHNVDTTLEALPELVSIASS